MMNELISIIIPVFKVEKYLDRCLESVTAQSYTNLEIILVDDGSPDKCPEMCDLWAKKDSRIKVIHKENDGLANARNSGIEACTGDYVMFIDSDDYIESDMVEFLYKLAKDNNADVSRCGFYVNNENDNSEEANTNDVQLYLYSFNERIRDLLLGGHISGVAWNKLYARDVIKSHLYEKSDGCSEDIMHNFRVYLDVEKTAFCNLPKYHYVIRNDSITNSKFGYGAFDIIRAKEKMLETLKNNPDLYGYAVKSFIISAFVVLTGCIRNDYYEHYNELVEKMLNQSRFVFNSSLFSKQEKLKLLLLKYFPSLYKNSIKRKYKK